MKCVQVTREGGPLELVERPKPEPGPGWVRVKVQACGVCHSDMFTKEGGRAGFKVQYPRVPGHEVAGVIDAVGAGVTAWKPGQRVGIGWYGSHCGECDSCRRGRFMGCVKMQVTGLTHDGGYSEYMVTPAMALALIPDDLSPADAAPLLCAGVTTFNALRNAGARAGDLVAILGIGGLGHLAVQYAAKMGFKTVAIARGQDKGPLAKKLGAYAYIDSSSQDPAAELTKLGGAKLILSTVTASDAISAVIGGLAVGGKLVVEGVSPEPIHVTPVALITKQATLAGWASGSSIDSQDTMAFSSLAQVRPAIETYPLDKAAEAYDRMMSGKARFRVVLTTGL
jgi:D-arabinose 1-dehydrogenase-like Zn-dependent alcohol dehydrogenase